MLHTPRSPGTIVAGTLLSLALTACAQQAERRAALAPPAVLAGQEERDRSVASVPSTQASDERQTVRATRENQRTRAQLERRYHVAQLHLAKAKIAIELGELRYHDQISHAEMEFELAKRRQQIFTKFTAPNRLARAELSLQQAEDNVVEARAELQQREQKSSTAQPAGPVQDKTPLERAQRRLERLERDLELRRGELKTLQEVTLPLEQSELDLAAEEKKRAVLQTQRDNEGAIIDRQIAFLNAEAEVTRLEEELADLAEEAEESPPSGTSGPSR